MSEPLIILDYYGVPIATMSDQDLSAYARRAWLCNDYEYGALAQECRRRHGVACSEVCK